MIKEIRLLRIKQEIKVPEVYRTMVTVELVIFVSVFVNLRRSTRNTIRNQTEKVL